MYHGTIHDFDVFDINKCVGGIHLGTIQQALTRCDHQGYVLQVELSYERIRRSKDMGGGWKKKITSAQTKDCDAIVYLNRYEGMGFGEFKTYSPARLDTMSDQQFKKIIPNATDSWIAFNCEQVLIIQKMTASQALQSIIL